MDEIEKLEQQREERKAAQEKARREQYALDLQAVSEIEAELGDDLDISLRVAKFKPGLPSLVGVRAPNYVEYKRYLQRLSRAGESAEQRIKALEELAECCWAYPKADAAELRKAMKDANPGLVASVGVKALKLAELSAAEEGKG